MSQPASRARYQDGYRRMLVDMHIPDWDEGFLARYEPSLMADLYERANVTSVMVYCKSHVGLSYWPTPVGNMHAGLRGRDVVGELVGRLRECGIGVCAYHSIAFDNLAAENNPTWRQRTLGGDDHRHAGRYGLCCLNNPDYRSYERSQLTELLKRYDFDALFLDMIFWRLVCGCDNCRERFLSEDGLDVPTVVDWTSPTWCRFHAARERWAAELTEELFASAREAAPGIAVTHNLAPALSKWARAQPLSACELDTFVAGDLYGDRLEQLVISKLMLHLGQCRPAEFMTTRCVSLSDHVRTRPQSEMQTKALAATAVSSAFLFIDAIDPSGAANAAIYDQIGEVFADTAKYEPFLGGEPLEDVGVYLSADSQMDFAENGLDLTSADPEPYTYPHVQAVRGACRALQRAHLPFGVITGTELDVLDRYSVVVVPSVARIRTEEVEAFRAYVKNGGSLYASHFTSLVEVDGRRHEDFLLADIFGTTFDFEEPGSVVYSLPRDSQLAQWASPQTYLSHEVRADRLTAAPLTGIPRLGSCPSAATLASLTLPYRYPAAGTAADHAWASIHSSPPWEDLDVPTIVENTYGSGRVIYSAAPLERVHSEPDETVFVGLIQRLLGSEPSYTVRAHPSVWASAFVQPDRSQLVLTFLPYPAELPAAPTTVEFGLRAPGDSHFRRLWLAPSGPELLTTEAADGTTNATVVVTAFAMVIAEYEPS